LIVTFSVNVPQAAVRHGEKKRKRVSREMRPAPEISDL
jgi:hypothetical protein